MMTLSLHLQEANYSHGTYQSTGGETLGVLMVDGAKRISIFASREKLLDLIDAARDLVDEIDRKERLKAAALVSTK